MATIKGTAKMEKYPGATDDMARYKGIDSYGWVSHRGYRALKVAHRNIRQLESIGYLYIGEGTSYAYMTPPGAPGNKQPLIPAPRIDAVYIEAANRMDH